MMVIKCTVKHHDLPAPRSLGKETAADNRDFIRVNYVVIVKS